MNPAPSVALLDVNETLSDLAPLAERFEQVGAPGDLVQTWFAATLRDGMALAASGRYADFPDVARAALRSLLAVDTARRRCAPPGRLPRPCNSGRGPSRGQTERILVADRWSQSTLPGGT